MADFKRKPGESFESFLRKFKKGLKNSKRLEKARSKQHLGPKKTKRLQKKHALTSLELRKKNEYLRKIGKLPESNMRA
ncbi:MAG: 30S ribosomal protein S21 [Patescibacteria group bacterium]